MYFLVLFIYLKSRNTEGEEEGWQRQPALLARCLQPPGLVLTKARNQELSFDKKKKKDPGAQEVGLSFLPSQAPQQETRSEAK